MSDYSLTTAPVDGGELAVGTWGAGGPLVVLVHGITSSHLAFGLVGPLLADRYTVVAPDLRGRGRSRDQPGPFGMARHAADVAALITSRAAGPAVVVGHSMGGFVAAELAHSRPDLVQRVVLVDGGAPLPLPPGVAADGLQQGSTGDAVTAAIAARLGSAYERLTQAFASVEAYREYWRAHPSMQPWSAAIEAYVDYDLVGEPPQLRPACRLEAAQRDGADLYATVGVLPRALPVPSVFLRAERGMLAEPEGLYAPGYPSHWLPGTQETTVSGVNHYSIVLAAEGARAVADSVPATGADRPG